MTFRIALRALARNKLRSFLTMLGIIIGVGAVIAMVAIGEGAKATIRSQIASLGTNVLIILPGTTTQGGVRVGFGSVNTLTDGDAKAIREEIRSVSFVSPVLRRGEQVVAGNLNWGTMVQGVAPEFQQIREWQVAEGRFLHDGDVENDAKVAVLGETVVRNLFGNDDPLESVIRIRNIPFRVVGVLARKRAKQPGSGPGRYRAHSLYQHAEAVDADHQRSDHYRVRGELPIACRRPKSKLPSCCANATESNRIVKTIFPSAISRTSPKPLPAARGSWRFCSAPSLPSRFWWVALGS